MEPAWAAGFPCVIPGRCSDLKLEELFAPWNKENAVNQVPFCPNWLFRIYQHITAHFFQLGFYDFTITVDSYILNMILYVMFRCFGKLLK